MFGDQQVGGRPTNWLEVDARCTPSVIGPEDD